MRILAIDTSCDDTSVAVTEGVRILSNVISSQVRYHKKYGGVVPMLAGRLHAERIDGIISLALARAKTAWKDMDALAVTYGPGLAPALQAGLATAKELAAAHDLPVYAVNHMAGHIASVFAQVGSKKAPQADFPALALLVSGGHSELVIVQKFGNFQIIGQTLDDALGEAYDKVGRMLGFGYPAARLVAQFAQEGALVYDLPIPMRQSGDLNLSYSGLKNAVRLLIEDLKKKNSSDLLTREQIVNVCRAFEESAQTSVLNKVEKALAGHSEVKQLVLGGGVAANTRFRKKSRMLASQYGVELLLPPNLKLCSDNAAMIGVAAYLGMQEGQKPIDPARLDRVPYLTLEDSGLFQ